MKCVHDYARENLKLTADTMKKRHDKTINFHEYNVGDAVWLHDATKKEGLSKKLRNHWIGPFLVIKKLSDVTYRIQETQISKPKVVHSDRLKPYLGENKLKWMDSDVVIISKGSENVATNGEIILLDGTGDFEDNCVHDSDDNCVVGDNVSGNIDYVPGSDNVSEECDVTGVKRSKRNCRVPKQFRDFHLY